MASKWREPEKEGRECFIPFHFILGFCNCPINDLSESRNAPNVCDGCMNKFRLFFAAPANWSMLLLAGYIIWYDIVMSGYLLC